MKQFQRIEQRKPKSATFDLSHEKKLTMNMGDLVPVFLSDVLPGDNFKINLETMIRFQPMIAPLMHRINVFMHWFFIPNRIIWNEWEDFITGGETGGLEPNFPKVYSASNMPEFVKDHYFSEGSLADYLGIPVHLIQPQTTPTTFSALPFRAYQEIYNEYYRDQNLQEKINNRKDSQDHNVMDGNDINILELRKRCWEKDYYTSSLPWAQRGDQVQIPLIGEIEVQGSPMVRKEAGNDPWQDENIGTDPGGRLSGDGPEYEQLRLEELYGSLEGSQTTITELRRAYALQRWLEKNARGGSRYIEQILSHFGVKSSDHRLQKPEYLGGGKIPVQISEVLQTSSSDETSAQGNMSGHGITSGNIRGFKKSFEEHGHVMGIMSILPRTAYQDGIHRSLTKFDRFDYFFPEFAHIGEQEVKNKEIFIMSNDEDDEGTFGYQERYAEYRYMQDQVHGDFRTNLDYWHMGRKFQNLPQLNQSFVEANPDDNERIFPVVDPKYHKLLVQTYADFKARRPVPKFGTPY